MKVSIIAGSPRSGSNSVRVSQYIQSIALENGVEQADVIDFHYADVPMVGRGMIDPENLTSFQSDLITSWSAADLIIFVVPEYNWSTNPEFLNALHQLGSKPFAYLFKDKVFAIAGVSSGRGGRLPAVYVSEIVGKLVAFLNEFSVISPKIYESQDTFSNVNEKGESQGNESYESSMTNFVKYNLALTQRWMQK